MFMHPTGRGVRKSPHVYTAGRPPGRVPRRGPMQEIRLNVTRGTLGQNASSDDRRIGSGKSMPTSIIDEKFVQSSGNLHHLVLGAGRAERRIVEPIAGQCPERAMGYKPSLALSKKG